MRLHSFGLFCLKYSMQLFEKLFKIWTIVKVSYLNKAHNFPIFLGLETESATAGTFGAFFLGWNEKKLKK